MTGTSPAQARETGPFQSWAEPGPRWDRLQTKQNGHRGGRFLLRHQAGAVKQVLLATRLGSVTQIDTAGKKNGDGNNKSGGDQHGMSPRKTVISQTVMSTLYARNESDTLHFFLLEHHGHK